MLAKQVSETGVPRRRRSKCIGTHLRMHISDQCWDAVRCTPVCTQVDVRIYACTCYYIVCQGENIRTISLEVTQGSLRRCHCRFSRVAEEAHAFRHQAQGPSDSFLENEFKGRKGLVSWPRYLFHLIHTFCVFSLARRVVWISHRGLRKKRKNIEKSLRRGASNRFFPLYCSVRGAIIGFVRKATHIQKLKGLEEKRCSSILIDGGHLILCSQQNRR